MKSTQGGTNSHNIALLQLIPKLLTTCSRETIAKIETAFLKVCPPCDAFFSFKRNVIFSYRLSSLFHQMSPAVKKSLDGKNQVGEHQTVFQVLLKSILSSLFGHSSASRRFPNTNDFTGLVFIACLDLSDTLYYKYPFPIRNTYVVGS